MFLPGRVGRAEEPAVDDAPTAAARSTGGPADAASDASDANRTAQEAAERHFAVTVLPLLKSKCFACHGADEDDVKGGLDMTSRDQLLAGGESGDPAFVPGRSDDSVLIAAVRWESFEMPPKENDRLTDDQIAAVASWIEAGAPWPDETATKRYLASEWSSESNADGVLVKTSGGLADEWTYRRYDSASLWAYRPLDKPDVPAGVEGEQPIDAFINRGLVARQVAAAPPADRHTLIRRATFDLLGLPPSPAEIEAFIADPSRDVVAFRRLVDRLLESPHYGEQWGRRWLDVVRYADSSGFANDYERGNAWRYRDYVVRSLNRDKPYDEFVREQLAGDEINADDPEMLVAVGFLRMGPWELTGMEVAKVARQRFLDDVTNVVGQVFLGHTLRCASCHDHKFDPVPTRDYYAMQAVFATTQLAERQAAFLPEENTRGFDERKYLEQRREHYERILAELASRSVDAARTWYAEQGFDVTKFEKAEAEARRNAKDARRLYEEIRSNLRRQGVSEAQIPPRHAGFTPRDYGLERVARKGLERLRWRFERYEPVALSVYSGRTPEMSSVYAPLRMPKDRMEQGELERTCILAGGDPFSPTASVQPNVLSAANSLGAPQLAAFKIPDAIEGRRLALAEWITHPNNPLAARVLVNRVWQGHFGTPLAGNPNNFGATGKRPTHPELLDWLAATFIEEGWSLKSLHRRIMNSHAYRRSSQHPAPELLAERDPLGESYAKFQPRRLDAEELRDALLHVSGELRLELGGLPIRPEMNLEVAMQPRMVMGTFAEAWQPSPKPEQRHRRSIYALRLRGLRDPFLEVFNVPSDEDSCEAREASTITPQVFSMFNSEISFDRALAMAARLQRATDSPEAAVALAFELAYGRPATEWEVSACRDHWQAMTARHQQLDFPPPEYPREVVREAVEENTGERFTFVEPLEVYADFQPDRKPSDASPEWRGLAEVCLVLLNANEFVYVY